MQVCSRTFVGQLTDEAERDRGWDRYHEILRYAESKTCKHLQICAHFGEIPKWKSCAACDACGCKLAWVPASPRMEKQPSANTATPPQTNRSRPESIQKQSSTEVDPDLREYLRQWRQETAKGTELRPSSSCTTFLSTSFATFDPVRSVSCAAYPGSASPKPNSTDKKSSTPLSVFVKALAHPNSRPKVRIRGEEMVGRTFARRYLIAPTVNPAMNLSRNML